MTAPIERRVRRMVRCYPRAWRARYGDEFGALLASEIEEAPRSPRRLWNVLRSGLAERARDVGLLDTPSDGARSARSGAVLVYASLTVALALGAGLWSQLKSGVRLAAFVGLPIPGALAVAAVLASIAAAGGLLLWVVVMIRVIARGARAAGARLLPPLAGLVTAAGVLVYAGSEATHDPHYGIVGLGHAGRELPAHGPFYAATLWIRGLALAPVGVRPGLTTNEFHLALIAGVATIVAVVSLVSLTRRLAFAAPPVRSDAIVVFGVAGIITVFAATMVCWAATTWTRSPDLLTAGPRSLAPIVGVVMTTTTAWIGARRVGRAPRARIV